MKKKKPVTSAGYFSRNPTFASLKLVLENKKKEGT
jgi:hypothetical protein